MTKITVDQTLESLRSNVESTMNLRNRDGKWGSVYLDNAVLPGQSVTQFRSHLSALSKRGEYIVLDGYAFGAAKLAA